MTDTFYTDILTAGAILTGFSGTFLQFRIQREASYFRQPVLKFFDHDECNYGRGVDAEVNLSHLSAAFLRIIFSTLSSMIFGFVLPLAVKIDVLVISKKAIVAGLFISVAFLIGYFISELHHYRVFRFLKNDSAEWLRQIPVLAASVVLATIGGLFAFGVFN